MREIGDLILDRLVDELTRPGRIADSKLQKLEVAHQKLQAERDRLVKENLDHNNARRALDDLYKTAEAMLKAKTPTQLAAARSRLSSAMCIADPFVDHIPF